MQTVKSRVDVCRLICKMQKDPEFGKKLGLEISPSFEERELRNGLKEGPEDVGLRETVSAG